MLFIPNPNYNVNSNYFLSTQVLQPPQEERNLTMDGYLQTDEENWELITEDGKSLKVNAQILSKHLQGGASNLEDALACLMPWNIDVVMMGIQ